MEDRTSYLLEQIARSSDEAAYRELYYTYYPSLFRFATTLLHEEQLAEEVVSDVFINIWKGRESLTSVRNLRVYLFVAVKNLCHRALTRRGEAPELLEEAHLTAAIGGGTKADEFLLSKELNHAFELAVASLPGRCRLIFRLVREEGLRYREIAIILNISQKTIEAQMTIATRRILQAMGDLNLWRKYGNALKLQIGMRIRKADPALAQQVVTEAMGAPLIASNNETAAVQTVTTLPANYHPVMAQYASGSPDLQYVAKALVDRLVVTKDPRLTLIASPTANSQKTVPQVLVYRGIDVALPDADLAAVVRADYSLFSTRTWFNKTFATPIPVYVMTYADVCFLRAEAALEGWGATPAQAATFYQEGVRAAMSMNPYFITTIPADFTEQTLPAGTKDEQLNKIMTQRWISLFSRSYDAYLEWRRTGYPVLVPGRNQGSTNGTIPRRTAYPSDEPILNAANYNVAKAKLSNGDAYTSRIWIDK